MSRLQRIAALATLVPALLASGHAQAEDAVLLCTAANTTDLPADQQHLRRIVAGADGWLFGERDFILPPLTTLGTQTMLQRFTEALQHSGIQFAIALVPSRGAVNEAYLTPAILQNLPYTPAQLRKGYEAKREDLQRAGIAVPDLMTPLHAASTIDRIYFKRDHHWTPRGATLAAQTMALSLHTLPSISLLPERLFKTETGARVEHKGSYGGFVAQQCGIGMLPETRFEQRTLPVDATLLDDSQPGIVLVGTSYSDEKYNFAGALSEALHRDIDNRSVTGGGAGDSILSYLTSPDYAAHKPALLIWEVPDIYSLNTIDLWRQLIPAAKGACTTADALASSEILPTARPLLPELAGINTRRGRDFLYLETTDTAFLKFTVSFHYADGSVDDVKINRTTRTQSNGRFFIQLNGSYTAALTGITLEPESTSTSPLTARLCKG